MAAYYEGSICHNEDTIHDLFRTQYVTYSMGRVIAAAAVGAALAAAALFAPLPMYVQGMLMLFGCLLFAGREFPAALRAEDTLEARKGALPDVQTRFYSGHMEVQEGKAHKKFRYEKLDRLVQDKNHLYLFLGPDSVVMVDRTSLPEGCEQQLMELVQKRSGKHWEQPISLLTLNLRDLVRMHQSSKKAAKSRKS